MDKLRQILSTYESDYYPEDSVADQLRSISMAAFIGPVAVGKTTCMEQIAQLDDQFGIVRSFATRARRIGEADNEYRFLDQENYSLNQIAIMARTGKGGLVQYAVHTTTGHIYGSMISDYDHPYMMVPVLSQAMSAFRRLPFNKRAELTIVTEPDEWVKRFNKRDAGPEESSKRAIEGKQSLEWSLDQGESMIWVCTPSGVKPETAVEIRDLITGDRKPNPDNRLVGKELLKVISSFL